MMTVKNPATLDFSSSTQDVILVLGEPDSITYKAEDPLSIHKKEVRDKRQLVNASKTLIKIYTNIAPDNDGLLLQLFSFWNRHFIRWYQTHSQEIHFMDKSACSALLH